MTGLVSQEVVLVDVHHQELAELHVLMPLQGCAVAGPAQPLEVDAQALRELRRRDGRSGGPERDPGGPRAEPDPGFWEQSQIWGAPRAEPDLGVLGAELDLGGSRGRAGQVCGIGSPSPVLIV